ncbi:Putative transposase and inactivated derivative [Vibrio vulnificus CMCP6]|uniref:Transposase and inactivated derivative n=1 Tax=Vibrio vulnificus (strain CMCP6) TaxID=216895 RepID=A0A3Q0L7C9_VIBVU|nr:Putative transposase and inactivated derivative [Vibrio vulnificus CMCP6]
MILRLPDRAERRRITKKMHKTKDKDHYRHLNAILLLSQGRAATLPFLQIAAVLTALLALNPQSLGYQRSRWRTESMAIEVNRIFGFNAHSSTIRRWGPKLGIVWRRACISKIQIKKPNSPESKRH